MSGAVFGTYLIPFKFSGMGDMEFLFPFSFGVCIGSLVLVGLVTFRRHKDMLYPSVPDNQRLFLAFIWLADEHFPTAEVEKRVVRLMQRIAER
jgi:glucose uptake protein